MFLLAPLSTVPRHSGISVKLFRKIAVTKYQSLRSGYSPAAEAKVMSDESLGLRRDCSLVASLASGARVSFLSQVAMVSANAALSHAFHPVALTSCLACPAAIFAAVE